MRTLLHVDTQHAPSPTGEQAAQFETIVKQHKGNLDGCSDKGVYVVLPEVASVRAFTQQVQSAFPGMWVDVVPNE